MAIRRQKIATALDLELKGSLGTFVVRAREGAPPVRVQYLQTHLHLAFDGSLSEKLLAALRPVREVFAPADLSFEQIMQRDIDDARVSTELIPYLLDEAKTGLVKLFPPIVVVVLPTAATGVPANHYAPVETFEEEDPDLEATVRRVRSGPVGAEIFELRQIVEDGEAWDHDYATLRLNTAKSALVIVDGQHRAMGLIALYRNKKGWPESTARVQPYYRMWPAKVIDRYDLSDAKLPVMFCVFPDLDGRDPKLPKVHEACRSIFLALNKNARRVTRSRNTLLDDGDVIAAFLRDTLTIIKDEHNFGGEAAIRLWCAELDAEDDRTPLVSPVAVTGVTHLFGLIERIMFGSFGANAITPKRGNQWLKTRLDLPFTRLGLRDAIPKAVQDSARRRSIRGEHSEVAQRLIEAFREQVGELIVRGLDRFAPYRANHEAALQHNSGLVGATADFYRSIIYDGQSHASTFKAFAEGLTEDFRDAIGALNSPEFDAVRKDFKGRKSEYEAEVRRFRQLRNEHWVTFRGARDGYLKSEALVRALDESFKNVLVTAAFQNALFLTFFMAVQAIDEGRSKANPPGEPISKPQLDALFDEYLAALDRFFALDSPEKVRAFLAVFHGRVEGEAEGAQVVRNHQCLGESLIPGELKPDEWTRFRVILIELWKPKSADVPELEEYVKGARKHLRAHAFTDYCQRAVREEERVRAAARGRLPASVVSGVRDRCAEHFSVGLVALGDRRMTPDMVARLWTAESEAELQTDSGAEGPEDP